jgi:hypothetical protein
MIDFTSLHVRIARLPFAGLCRRALACGPIFDRQRGHRPPIVDPVDRRSLSVARSAIRTSTNGHAPVGSTI